MREQLQARLKVLKAEWTVGQVKLRELELQQLRLRELLLRLRGAIRALEDLLGQAKPDMARAPARLASCGTRAECTGGPGAGGGPGTQGGGPP